jgi:hypothetical protein
MEYMVLKKNGKTIVKSPVWKRHLHLKYMLDKDPCGEEKKYQLNTYTWNAVEVGHNDSLGQSTDSRAGKYIFFC